MDATTLPSPSVAAAGAGCPHLARLAQAAPAAECPARALAARPASAPVQAGGWWAFRAQALAAGARA